MSKPYILITGGAGFIGSHCALVLLEHGFDVVVIDNCSNAYLGMYVLPKTFYLKIIKCQRGINISLSVRERSWIILAKIFLNYARIAFEASFQFSLIMFFLIYEFVFTSDGKNVGILLSSKAITNF